MKRIVTTLIPLAFVVVVGCSGDTAEPVAADRASQTVVPTAPVQPSDARPTPGGDTSAAPSEDTAKVNAETVLAAALTTATEQNKRVLVHLGAPW